MKTFLKANLASLSASIFDYLITLLLVKFLHKDALLGGVLGTLCGGGINFLMGRYWVFKTNTGVIQLQGKKYLLAWLRNLILNISGLYMFIKLFKVQYMVAKITTSIMVAVVYNYHVQKRYVFKISN